MSDKQSLPAELSQFRSNAAELEELRAKLAKAREALADIATPFKGDMSVGAMYCAERARAVLSEIEEKHNG